MCCILRGRLVIVLVCTGQGGTVFYDGIPSQTAANAIRACMGKAMPERLQNAADAALREGYVTAGEYDKLTEELGTT